jgi:hypothetical protein
MTPAAENFSDQRQDTLVGDPTAHLLHQQSVMDRPETILDIAFNYPLITAGWVDEAPRFLDRVLRPAPGPESVRGRAKVRLEDRLEHERGRHLDDPVAQGRDAQASELPRPALGDLALAYR